MNGLQGEVSRIVNSIDELNNSLIRLHLMKYSSEISFIMRVLAGIRGEGAEFLDAGSFALTGGQEVGGDTFSLPEIDNVKEHLLDAEQEVMAANAFLPGFLSNLRPSDHDLMDSIVALYETSLSMWVVAQLNLEDIYDTRLQAEILDMRRQFRIMYDSITDGQE